MQIKKLAGDTQLSREEVLTFLKWWRSLPDNTKASFTEATVAAEQALEERKAIRESQKAERGHQAWRTFQGKGIHPLVGPLASLASALLIS